MLCLMGWGVGWGANKLNTMPYLEKMNVYTITHDEVTKSYTIPHGEITN